PNRGARLPPRWPSARLLPEARALPRLVLALTPAGCGLLADEDAGRAVCRGGTRGSKRGIDRLAVDGRHRATRLESAAAWEGDRVRRLAREDLLGYPSARVTARND